MDPIQTNNTLLYSLATFVNQQIESSLEGRLQVSLTDSNIVEIKEKVLADLDDVDAAAVAEKISVCDVAELIDPSVVAKYIDTDRIVDALDVDSIKDDIASKISARSIAREIDTDDIADTVAQGLDLSEIAQHIDASDLAQYIDADSSEIASNLYEDESFVEKVANKITYNMVDSHAANVALKAEVADALAQQIDARIAAATANIAEQVTQRVLAQIGSTLVSLLTGGAKPQ